MSWYDNVFLAEPEYFDDYENPAVLERCIVRAEDVIICDYLPEWFDMESFKNGFNKLYDAFINSCIDEFYIDEHAAWLDHKLSY
jgi:hypothetical protein